MRTLAILLPFVLTVPPLWANDYVVAPSGGDFTSIQAALNVAGPGDRVLVREKSGGWRERVVVTNSGSPGSWLELREFPGDTPILNASGLSGQWMITVQDRSWVRISGLELINNQGQGDGSGVRIEGAGDHLEVLGCHIHGFTGADSMAVTVYGTRVSASLSDIVISGNWVHDCTPAQSEAITLNGNVENFTVSNNLVHDVNNIAIDFIGGEASINPLFGARNGVCSGNVVLRANSNYGGGYAAGIYVDGGTDIVIENNFVAGSDLGIEVGAENQGWTVTGVVVRGNLLVANDKAGLVFGGYAKKKGRVNGCSFVNNLCFQNDTQATGVGEIWVQWANDNLIANNVFRAGSQKVLVYSDTQTSGNLFDHNLYFVSGAPDSASFEWGGSTYQGLAAWQAGSGQDPGSLFGDPLFSDPDGADNVLGSADDDFRLLPGSPAIDAGTDIALGPYVSFDRAGQPRWVSDIGAAGSGTGVPPLLDMGPLEHFPPANGVWRYCVPTPNTSGAGSWMGWSGSTSLAANSLTLRAMGLPANQFGLFFGGTDPAQTTVGNGLMCVGGSFFRLLPALPSDSSGSVVLPLDLSVGPLQGLLAPGVTLRFQHWTRDPTAGGSGYDFSEGLAVTFTL